MNLIDFTLLSQGWSLDIEIGTNLAAVLLAVCTGLPGLVAAWFAYRAKIRSEATEKKVDAAADVQNKTHEAVNTNHQAMAEDLKGTREDLKGAREDLKASNEEIVKISKLLADAKTEQAQADMARTMVQKVNGGHPAAPTAAAPTIVNVEEMHVEADQVSIDQKGAKT